MLKKHFMNVFQNMKESQTNVLADAIKDILSITTKAGSQTAAEARLPHFRTDTLVSGLLSAERQ